MSVVTSSTAPLEAMTGRVRPRMLEGVHMPRPPHDVAAALAEFATTVDRFNEALAAWLDVRDTAVTRVLRQQELVDAQQDVIEAAERVPHDVLVALDYAAPIHDPRAAAT